MLKAKLPPSIPSMPWVRLPVPGERLCGLTRTTLYQLSCQGKIRTVVVRQEGTTRGIRLLHLPSLLEYLEGLLANQSAAPNHARETIAYKIEDDPQ
jgi:hypothetical protein